MADAMKPARQEVKEEAADKLVGADGHDLLAFGLGATIVLVAHRDAALVERDQPPVGYGEPVGVARQIGENSLGGSERRLGIDHPAALPDPSEMGTETR